MKVPFADLKPVASLVHAPVMSAWADAASNTEFVGGPTVAKLEERLGSRMGAAYVVSCASGSDALTIGLRTLGIGPGCKVAIPNLTFWATYEAVLQLGATPVLIDVNEHDLQMSLMELKRAHATFKLDAAILVHLMGWGSANVSEFRSFCGAEGIKLLEDGAQSFGVLSGGNQITRGALISTVSFYPAKVLGGCMNGGAILTDDPELAALSRKLCNHGRSSHFSYSLVGWNSRIGAIQAHWLLAMLDHADDILSDRRQRECQYRDLFASLSNHVTAFGPPDEVIGNGYLSVCTLNQRSRPCVTERLAQAGIGFGRVYPETIAEQVPARNALRCSQLDRARSFCKSVVNLPLFYGMTDEQFERVCDVFSSVLKTSG